MRTIDRQVRQQRLSVRLAIGDMEDGRRRSAFLDSIRNVMRLA